MQVEKGYYFAVREWVIDSNESVNITPFGFGEIDGKNAKRPPLAFGRIGAHNS